MAPMAPIPSKLRSATASALSTSARALSLSSHLLEGLSGLLRPAEREQEPVAADQEPGPATAEGPGPVATTDPVGGVAEHARTFETHVEELAAKPAAEVISRIEQLSTDELERLYSHEQGNKKRKTVITAIEQSLAPRQGT